MLQVHLLKELPLKGPGDGLNVHIVAVGATLARAVSVLPAPSSVEVPGRRILRVDLPAVEESPVDRQHGLLGVFLLAETHVQVAGDVVAQIIHHDHIFDLPVLTQLLEHILVELLELCHCLLGVLRADRVPGCQGGFHWRVFINVLQHQRLAHWRFVMDALAALPVTAGSHLEVKWAVHLVVFGTVYPSKAVCH